MMHDTRSSPSREGRPGNNPTRTPLLDLRHEAVSSLAADRPQKLSEQYQDQWEVNFLHHLARQMYDDDFGNKISRQRYGDVEQESRRRQLQSRNKSHKKGMAKYKAYAVKMKIPSYHELTKPRRELRNGETVQCKNRTQFRGIYEQSRGGYQPPSMSRIEEVFRANIRDIAIAHVFQSSNANIFKKRPIKNNKNPTIRKRSIKTTEKRRDEEEAKASLNKFLKTSTSPKINKKCVMSLDQSSLEPAQTNTITIKETNQLKIVETTKSKKGIKFVKPSIKSPQKEKDDRSGLKSREGIQGYDSTSKLLQKVDKAIHFKKKDKAQSPTKVAINELALQKSQKSKDLQAIGSQLVQTSKTVIRTIYTSKDVIRAKNNVSRQVRQLQNRRESTNNKVFIFNSEDNYIKRLLAKSGWIHNHDHRSHFYHLKWVFKPDAIDYNLKPDQYVNHVKNSHELTSKHYLNKNLKSYLSSWPKLYEVYPHSYDFAKPAEKQDFYTHFKKQIMMNLLQNVYEYFLSVRRHKIQTLTRFYTNLLQQDGTYSNISPDNEGSPLRKNHFRKIDMEDYKQYDNSFLVHMNLLIVALKYWRFLRKSEQLQQDDDRHFLVYREKQFQDNLQDLQRYSKMPVFYTSATQSYFQRQFYATPSETAIERVVKEYVYFQRQLGRQWKVFGRGNIWIVKPCSASRGTGIYLANDCAEILTDNRGIQSKIVQRYIQRPLIMRSGIAKGRKFDLRQWVLLRSVEPLQIYMFSHCYLRVCSQQFVISNIQNLKAHLTNYSFNKRHFQQPAESVIDQDTFQNLLLEERNVNFMETVRPKIKDIIIRSIKSTQHLISDCGQACFSLLGYDILLDDWCEPWLLEVNMSPACEERTEWLRKYLNAMGRDLLKIVLPESYVTNAIRPSGRGSELPVKKCWQGEQDFPQNELKKIKTEISQSNEEVTSYVNAIFQLNASKMNQQCKVEDVQDEKSEEASQQLGEKITYAEFINEHMPEDIEFVCGHDQSPQRGSHWQNITLQQNNNQINQARASLEQKFGNLELYLPQGEKSQILSPKKNIINHSPQLALNSPSPSLSLMKPEYSEISLMRLESQLKWQRICFQDYSGARKDGETHFQLIGNRINSAAIAQIDKAIQYTQIKLQKINSSCIVVQQAIKKYLNFKRNQKKPSPERKGLKLKVPKLQQSEIRESKSALYNHQEKSWCFEKPNKQLFQSKLQRPITARNVSGPPSSKNRGNDSFRQKIRSIALQAALRESCQQAQSQHLSETIVEQICGSGAQLGGAI